MMFAEPSRLRISAINALAFCALSTQAVGQSLDIKGVRIGMPKDEVNEKLGDLKGFTIGGVAGKYPHISILLKYHEDKLDSLIFFFEPKNFSQVHDAVKGKYQGIDCVTSTVSNAMGASFEQTKCRLEDSDSILGLSKYTTDISTSALSLLSKRGLSESSKRREQNKKDI